MKRRFVAFLMVVLLLLAAVGCIGPERSPKEVVLLYVDALRGDVEGLSKYDPEAVPEEGFWAESLEGQDIAFTPEQVDAYVLASQAALKRSRVTAVGETINGGIAVVKLEILQVDFVNTVTALAEAIDWSGKTSEDVNSMIADLMIRGLNEAPLTDRLVTQEVTLTKVNGLWVLDEASAVPLVNSMILFQ